jgi:site-specific DNA-methyltransferase (adenine-specific)
MWVYGSGFPKSHNIGKAIDKIEGNEREVLGTKAEFSMDGAKRNPNNHREVGEAAKEIQHEYGYKQGWDAPVTKGNGDWEGWGTALKPAHEPIVMARKPLSEKSIAENVLKHGTGGINIDGSRIAFENTKNAATNPKFRKENNYKMPEPGQESNGAVSFTSSKNEYDTSGRFPANIIFDEEAGQLLDEQSGVKKSSKRTSKYNKDTEHTNTYTPAKSDYRDDNTYDDKGGASRFFYCPKAAKKDRNEGLVVEQEKNKRPVGVAFNTEDDLFQQGSGNHHPTVKPTDLMRYLINLVTPPNGTILDPFMGSGSTGKAAVRCGLKFIGIEREQEYMDIATARIQHEQNKPVQTQLF